MALTREKKKELIEKLKAILAGSESAVFVNFHGLSVADTSAMRKELKEEGVHYLVAKKTLIKHVLGEAGFKGDLPPLDGELALAYTVPDGTEKMDVIAPARGVAEFTKKHKENLSILGGIFEGEYKNKEDMEVIAAIPSLHTLRGMFVNVINSPIQGLAVALSAMAETKTSN